MESSRLFGVIDNCISEKGKAMVTLIGGGGKTTTLFCLFKGYLHKHKVLVTTTTAMYHPGDLLPQIHFKSGSDEFLTNLDNDIGSVGFFEAFDRENNKVSGVDPAYIDRIYDDGTFDLILVEGDGSKGRPLKAYAAYEPVIPEKTDLVLFMVGLDGLHHPLSEETVHRSELFKAGAGMEFGDEVRIEHVLRVMESEYGPSRKIPKTSKVILVLNKAASYPVDIDKKKLGELCINTFFDEVIMVEMKN